jgi:ribonuclease T2
MPAMLDSFVQAAKDGVHNAAASALPGVAESTAMPSLRTLSKIAFGAGQVILGGGGGQRVMGDFVESCPMPQLSCHNTTAVENLCCFNAPGGQLLQTQFWDTAPATGPEDSWTLHGLWYVTSFNCPRKVHAQVTSVRKPNKHKKSQYSYLSM